MGEFVRYVSEKDFCDLFWPRETLTCDLLAHEIDRLKVKVKEHIVLREIHLRTTRRHLSMGSHSVICHPTEVTAECSRDNPNPSPQPGGLVLDLSTP